MSRKLKVVIGLLVIAVGVHLYLSYTHYTIKHGVAEGKSSCNINKVINCDAVSASKYSYLFDIPISIFGAVTNFTLIGIFLLLIMGLTEDKKRILRYGFQLSAFMALASIVYGFILFTQLSVVCLYCIALYIISFIVFGLLYLEAKPFSQYIVSDFLDLFKNSRIVLGILLLIPVLSLFLHSSLEKRVFKSNGKMEQIVRFNIQEWQQNPLIDFDETLASLSKGDPESNVILIEFADFRCSHCKKAAPTISAFAGANPNVRVLFFNFPLDGSCNPNIPHSSGISCRLAKSVHCANKQNKGWTLHDIIFEKQNHFSSSPTVQAVDQNLKAIHQQIGLKWSKLLECMDSEVTHKAIIAQAKMGAKAKVSGTPAIFMNGRFLPKGQILPVLNKAMEKSL